MNYTAFRKGRILNVRMQSNAGFYIGSIEFESGEAQPYDRNTCYYNSEALLHKEYPNSISMKEAFEEAKRRRLYHD